MFDAVCAKCGADCQVPFRPNGRKEVFCSKCFETNGGDSGSSRSFGDSRSSGRYEKRDNVGTYFSDRQMFDAICDECGDRCKIPFQPRGDKPVLCSHCFSAKNEGRDSRRAMSAPSARQSYDKGIDLEAINAKLDKILKLLTPKKLRTESKEESKEITEKILEEIQLGTEKKLAKTKRKSKKSVVKES